MASRPRYSCSMFHGWTYFPLRNVSTYLIIRLAFIDSPPCLVTRCCTCSFEECLPRVPTPQTSKIALLCIKKNDLRQIPSVLIDGLGRLVKKGPLLNQPCRGSSPHAVFATLMANTRSTAGSLRQEIVYLAVDDRPMFSF